MTVTIKRTRSESVDAKGATIVVTVKSFILNLVWCQACSVKLLASRQPKVTVSPP